MANDKGRAHGGACARPRSALSFNFDSSFRLSRYAGSEERHADVRTPHRGKEPLMQRHWTHLIVLATGLAAGLLLGHLPATRAGEPIPVGGGTPAPAGKPTDAPGLPGRFQAAAFAAA